MTVIIHTDPFLTFSGAWSESYHMFPVNTTVWYHVHITENAAQICCITIVHEQDVETTEHLHLGEATCFPNPKEEIQFGGLTGAAKCLQYSISMQHPKQANQTTQYQSFSKSAKHI